MNFVLKIMIYTLCLNFAVGIISTALPGISSGNMRGLSYDANAVNPFQRNVSLSPTSLIQDATFQIARLMDLIGLGFINNIVNFLHDIGGKYLYGFPNLLESMFGSSMSSALRAMIFGSMKGIITISYFLGVFSLFTNRSLDKDRG